MFEDSGLCSQTEGWWLRVGWLQVDGGKRVGGADKEREVVERTRRRTNKVTRFEREPRLFGRVPVSKFSSRDLITVFFKGCMVRKSI